MNFNEFVNGVKDNIKRFLPEEYENAEVSVMDYQKLNTTYKGLMVKKEDETITPTINMDQLYKAYQNQPGRICRTRGEHLPLAVKVFIDKRAGCAEVDHFRSVFRCAETHADLNFIG